MNTEEFNRLLTSSKYDQEAKAKLYVYCYSIIKRRLMLKVPLHKVESLTHSILQYFMEHAHRTVSAPYSYIVKSVNNYLSNLKKRKRNIVPIENDIPYEQNFDELEQRMAYKTLLQYLSEEDAKIMYYLSLGVYKEIELAKMFNMNYDAFRQRICRIRKKVKKYKEFF